MKDLLGNRKRRTNLMTYISEFCISMLIKLDMSTMFYRVPYKSGLCEFECDNIIYYEILLIFPNSVNCLRSLF